MNDAASLAAPRGLQALLAPPPARPGWRRRVASALAALALWLVAWVGARLLDHHVDLANQAMLFVIASVLASAWLSEPIAFVFALACTLSFNWGFVPPRGTLAIGQNRHAALLGAMLAGTWLVVWLVGRLRAQAAMARE